MDNQHKKIKGYRDLTQDEINLMNDIKEVGELVRKLTGRVSNVILDDIAYATTLDQDKADTDDTLMAAIEAKEWAESAKEDLQVGFMKLVRSIARPTTF